MANRNFSSGGKLYSMHVMPVFIDCNVTIGAAGAVSSFKGPMVASVSHVSTGIYQLNLQSNFYSSLFNQASMQSPVSGLSGILQIEIQNAPSTSISSLTAPSLMVKCLNASGAVADPASGSVLNVLMIMNNSSVKS